MHEPPPGVPLTAERRTFLVWATHGLGGLFGAALGLPALGYLLDARHRKAKEGGFQTVAKLADLPVGVPQQVVIKDVRRDAWTIHPEDVVGRVWLVRRASEQVDAYTTICPHLGCSINFQETSKQFLCPCHGGTFDLQGHKVERTDATNPAPRGMDHLECRRDPDNKELIQVKYCCFLQGRESSELRT